VKRILGLAVVGIAALLVACGGGSTNPTPSATSTPTTMPAPTTQPAPTYHVHVAFSGGASLASPQSVRGARAWHSHVLDTSSSTMQLPIEVGTIATDPMSLLAGDHENVGIATVIVSPQPSASPSATLTGTGVTLAIAPAVEPSPPGPEFNVSSMSTTTASGSVIADVTSPITTTETVPFYVQKLVQIGCNSTTILGQDAQAHAVDQVGGLSISGGLATPASSIAQADLYFDGPQCTSVGFINSSESEATIHFPFGAVFESSTTTPFATLSAASWSNLITSATYTQLLAGATAATNPQDELLIKTASGSIVKLALLGSLSTANERIVRFLFAQSGSSADGF